MAGREERERDAGDDPEVAGAGENEEATPLGLTPERLLEFQQQARTWLGDTEAMQAWLSEKILVNIQIRQLLIVENPESKANAALRAA